MSSFYKKPVTVLIFTLIFLVCCIPYPVHGASQPARVLIINSYHLGYSWSDAEMDGVIDGFTSEVEISYEFMDTKRIESEEYLSQLTELIQLKYAGNHFNLIITLDDRAYQYILNNHDILYPDVPVVFCGVNNFSEQAVQGISWITGTVETIDYIEAISLIHDLRPDTKTVYILTDSTYTGFAYRQQMNDLREQAVLPVSIRFIGDYEDGIEWEQLLADISNLPENSAILYFGYTRDILGNVFNENESTATIVQAANVPVFVGETQFLLGGAIGGKLKDPYIEGLTAGQMGQRILDGTAPDQIAIRIGSSTVNMFDHQALEQWEIPAQLLPEDSKIVNIPQKNMTINRQILTLIGVVVVVESALIILLFSLNRRRKIAETALRNEQLMLEQKVDERTQELQEALQVKDRFMANMSHELRTPLTAIIGFSELLVNQIDHIEPEKLRHSLAHIHRSGEHLLSLINEVLSIAKYSSNQVKLSRSQVKIDQLVHDAIMMVENLSQKKEITIEQNLDRFIDQLWVDELRLRQVLIILLNNAIKFSDEKSVIHVSSQLNISDANEIVISVQDHGIGIAPEDHKRIFEPFIQVDNELSRAYEGSGLGLALAQQLVDLHQGRIEVESALGEGTTMKVILPIGASSQEPSKRVTKKGKEREEYLRNKFRSLTILLAEENQTTIDLLSLFLSEKGYSMLIARNGEEAIELVKHQKPDIILLELHLPKVDGYEVIHKIRSMKKHQAVPILVISASVFDEEIGRCMEMGANAFLKKPFTLQDVLDQITSLLK